jgi:uncharacterized membrane protein YbhN (UPF0104 family)
VNRAALRRVAGPLVLGAAAIALLVTLRGQGSEAREALGRTDLASLALAFFAVMAGLLASAQVWRILLADLGSPLTQREMMHVFFVGQLGKYIPGSVFAMTSQMQLGRARGVPRTRTATSWMVFMGVLIATGALCASVALPLTSPTALEDRPWVLLLLPAGFTCLSPPVLNRVLGFALAKLRRTPLDRLLSWRGIGGAVAWALVMWGCYAAHLVLLVDPQSPEPGHRLGLLALGAFALAWVAGLLVIVAPAGAGAREAVLIVALAPVLTVPAATAVALSSRLLLTLGDAAWAGIAFLQRPREVSPRARILEPDGATSAHRHDPG